MQVTWDVDADASLQSVLDDPDCPQFLRDALAGTVPWQLCNRTRVRGVLASPRIAPRWVAALLALGAVGILVKGDRRREDLLEAVLEGQGDGQLASLRIEAARVAWGEASVARTPAEEPIVAVAAAVVMDGAVVERARVALTGVWQEPVRLTKAPAQMAGRSLGEDLVAAVAAAIEKEVAPVGNFLASADYRRAMAGVLAGRALRASVRNLSQ